MVWLQPAGAGGPAGESGGLEGLLDLAREAGAEGRRLRAAFRPNAQYTGCDAAGAIRVTVDGRTSVCDVKISANWWQSVDHGRLGEALREAHGQAVAQVLIEMATALEEPGSPDPGDPRPIGSDVDAHQPSLAAGNEFHQGAVGDVADDSVTVYGRGGMLSVTVRDTGIVDIRPCRSSLTSVPVHRLSEEALSALLAAETAVRKMRDE